MNYKFLKLKFKLNQCHEHIS